MLDPNMPFSMSFDELDYDVVTYEFRFKMSQWLANCQALGELQLTELINSHNDSISSEPIKMLVSEEDINLAMNFIESSMGSQGSITIAGVFKVTWDWWVSRVNETETVKISLYTAKDDLLFVSDGRSSVSISEFKRLFKSAAVDGYIL